MNQKSLKLLNVSQTANTLGMSNTKFWRVRKANGFPKPMKIHGGIGWPMYKIEEWIEGEFNKAQD
ncbi:helix-turn-helix transcriptional regulator [Vibrio comitans]|uniref:AlpA family phage regulatory protein n=1 Tax=Vibrio comitans NBRC 102076 TaxID=1219078 RepID=A0A4Y3IM69_9VIBR|nr:AlpA family phage regulatory protein [Vibrio comitans]GEA60583.1 hypothetical protein VCO01S_17760 [Vibrio comitans NBRC 102076]